MTRIKKNILMVSFVIFVLLILVICLFIFYCPINGCWIPVMDDKDQNIAFNGSVEFKNGNITIYEKGETLFVGEYKNISLGKYVWTHYGENMGNIKVGIFYMEINGDFPNKVFKIHKMKRNTSLLHFGN